MSSLEPVSFDDMEIPAIQKLIEPWERHARNIERVDPEGAARWKALIESAEEAISEKRINLKAAGSCSCHLGAPCNYCLAWGGD